MADEPATPLAWADLSEGMTATVPFSVSAEDMRLFAQVSGDYNDLHVSDAFAQSKGFDSAVVYGGLLVAKVSNLIGMRLPGLNSVWTRIALDFRKPLYVGQEAEVTGTVASLSESTGMVGLKLAVRREGKVLAKGEAEVLLVKR